MENYEIAITRAKSFFGCSREYDVEIDGLFAGRLKNGRTLFIDTSIGLHTINFLEFGKVQKSIKITVQPERYDTRLWARLDALQRLVISNADQTVEMAYQNTDGGVGRGLAVCKTCGQQVAKNANKCPNCGASRNLITQTVCALILALVFVGTVVMVGSNLGGNDKKPNTALVSNGAEEVSNRSISAENLWIAYSENTVNADKWFKGQTISVTGTITDIGQDMVSKKPCVSLDSGNWLYPIQCFFSDADQTELVAKLKDGQEVTITGECIGLALANVQLADCYIE